MKVSSKGSIKTSNKGYFMLNKYEMFKEAVKLGLVGNNEKPSDYTYRALQALLNIIK